MTDRCAYSDLHPNACAHCTGATDLTGPTAWDDTTHERPDPPTQTVRRPLRLPVLGNGQPDATSHYDIHDMVDELTRAHGHRERYTVTTSSEVWNGHHITDVPSLVDQLLGATPAGSTEQSGSTPHSRPAARIEALDTIMLIDDEAARWLRRLGENDPGDRIDPRTGHHVAGSGTIRCIQILHGLHASADTCGRPRPARDDSTGRPNCCTRHLIEHDVRRWWHQARIITGWDSPAYRPFNTCPVCEQRGTLRVNLAMHAGFCVDCRSVWGADDIGLLAEHIRQENAEDTDEVAS